MADDGDDDFNGFEKNDPNPFPVDDDFSPFEAAASSACCWRRSAMALRNCCVANVALTALACCSVTNTVESIVKKN